MSFRHIATTLLAALAVLVPQGAGAESSAPTAAAEVELVGAFVVGASISGATLHDGYLYVTTTDRVSIYDISEPAQPLLVGTSLSPNSIYGELLSTNGETLLLNDGLTGGTLDVWDVEDKTHPVLAASVVGVNDEHVSCLLDCAWAYGSAGSIIDLRDRERPSKEMTNWQENVGHRFAVHRLDEYRHGYMMTAPREGYPEVIDVRNPLRPRVIARAEPLGPVRNPFLYSYWTDHGRGRYVISSTETGSCSDQNQGALITFDTKGWPEDKQFEIADTFKYRGRTDSEEEGCTAYYYSLHPRFDDGGLVLLPSGLDGVRIVEISTAGQIEEVDSYIPLISDVWLAFWADDELFYALNTTGEVYILRYR